MPRISFRRPDGSAVEVDVDAGTTVMRAALNNSISEIVGECGGQAMCGSCHVYIHAGGESLPEVSDEEDEMLDCTSENREPNSRLSCQLTAGKDFENLEVVLPATQQ